ncbi:LuxR family transcriptional regulator [Actinoplanes sp. SE50]|uniref:response regulator transcription factor n=1 Tax=unclassified Actinoplanes TaxID=2626549 RepID=UPI00023EBF2F|nr:MULTISPECIES: response regulator transcription factor [unclassified Actinoplanes]AEV85134.1 Transcriptional regulatory protein degU [Actinoplanes sp. SE50/110]ATO83525.1 LuxR family transcriptional regulator [Actinoplanes sp. SE50]SLM00932.1 two-component system response regulator receiver [Actinoplanes sp. SE50/110]
MTEPIRVLIADDQTLLRDSFRVLLDSTPGFTVTGEAATGRDAARLALAHRPDVVLMDVRMPDLTGIEATELICRQTDDVRVLILTTFDLDEYVYGALRAGASGFLLKDTTAAGLIAAIRVVAAGEALLAPTVTRRLIAAFTAAPPRPAPAVAAHLTAREQQVLLLIARGRSNTEIAGQLRLSVPTVKTHVGRLLTKLAARDRAQLVVAAYESGLVTAAIADSRVSPK